MMLLNPDGESFKGLQKHFRQNASDGLFCFRMCTFVLHAILILVRSSDKWEDNKNCIANLNS